MPNRASTRRRQPDAALVDESDSIITGRKVGTVRVIGNLDSLTEWMRIQLLVIAGTLALALIVALAFTRRLQRSIVIPVEHLAETANRVATAKDYRLRATRLTDDEVGRLVDSFNGMLDRIEQQREAAAGLLQREQEASVLKDQFLAAVSHELRTPLNAILGWAHIVRHLSPDSETTARALESIERNAKAQARVVDDLLQVSRLAAGKVQMQFQLVDVSAVVESALDVVRPELAAKDLQLTVEMAPGPCFVAGNPGRLEQVLWNLLTNAVRFTPSGGVHVDVTTSETTVTVRVTDTGIGIASDFLPLVFDRFRQADGSLTRKYGGLGLGLAIAKELADLHGGSIRASSPGPGRGATFALELPKLAGQSGVEAGARTASRSALPLGGLRVLAIDEDSDALAILGTALRAEGALVSLAASGVEAVHAWRARRFDVLICDLAMPDMDGFAVLRAARDAMQGPNGTPVFAIALTAASSADGGRATEEVRFDARLAKPYRSPRSSRSSGLVTRRWPRQTAGRDGRRKTGPPERTRVRTATRAPADDERDDNRRARRKAGDRDGSGDSGVRAPQAVTTRERDRPARETTSAPTGRRTPRTRRRGS